MTGWDRFRKFSKLKVPFISMKIYSIIILISFLFITGCGYNPENPVYDTIKNPDNFPKAALELVNSIEQGKFNNTNEIIDLFSNLYLTEQTLLDNKAWKEVVATLGIKFRYQADQMVKEGVSSYSKAASYYSLASFARPKDIKLQAKQKLFSSWNGNLVDSLLMQRNLLSEEGLSLAGINKQISLFKSFYFTDSLHRIFSERFLVDQLLNDALKTNSNYKEYLDSLSLSDKIFLIYIKIIPFNDEKSVAQFVNPEIRLLAYDLIPIDSQTYRAELYFFPKQKFEIDYDIALWVHADSSDSSQSGYIPYDFSPVIKTTEWESNRVALASRTLTYHGVSKSISVGFYSNEDNQVKYIQLAETGANLVTLPISDSNR